jgi:DNA-binding MarR family transcriptional regulator
MAKANKKATATCLIEGDAQELIQLVGREIRRMGAQSVITGRTVADRFGLHTTDLECLDLIAMRHETTASELAQATGLTTGAMTAVVDRLEKAGYVVRIADPGDRRRHLIRIEPEAIAPIKAVYEPLQFAMFKLCSSLADRDLEIIREFLSRSTDLAVSCVEQIAREVTAKAGKRSSPRMSRQG